MDTWVCRMQAQHVAEQTGDVELQSMDGALYNTQLDQLSSARNLPVTATTFPPYVGYSSANSIPSVTVTSGYVVL